LITLNDLIKLTLYFHYS